MASASDQPLIVPEKPVSHRIEQLNSLIQQEAATILSREIDWPDGCFVTVTKAAVASDAESAKVWISVLPAGQEEAALKIVQGRIADIQSIFNKRLVMKFVPKLTFLIDQSQERASHITQVLDAMTSTDLGLSLDAATVEQERQERDAAKEAKGMQPGQALNPRPRRGK